jgi:cell division protein FtsB
MRGRAGLAFAALALAGVLALAVFPAKAVIEQRRNRTALTAQVARLSAQNTALGDRAGQLQTDAEIERLARQYNLVKPGEETYFILPRPDPPAAEVAPAAPPAPAHRSQSLWNRLRSIL